VANARTLFADVADDDVADDWSDDVSDDCAELLAWLLAGCWRGGSTRFSCRESGEDDAWRAWREWSRVGSAVVGACGHAVRRFFDGFSPVNSSLLPLRDGNVKNTC